MKTRVPILRQKDILIASIQDDLSDSEISAMQSDIIAMLIKQRSRGVIVDIALLQVLDSFGTRTLIDMSHAVQLRGAKMIIVGIQPEVAMSMVLLGLTLDDIPTALDLDGGLAYLEAG